jgi:hypothetical protein
MADQQTISQVLAQVEYADVPILKASFLVAQVEYQEEGGEPPAGDESPGLFFANG